MKDGWRMTKVAMMNVFIVVDRKVIIVLILPVSGMMLLWQCEVGDVCKLGFTLRTFLGCAWGGSWKGKHEKTYHLHPFALHVDSLNIHFAHPLKINRNAKNPIDPDHPWPSRTPSLPGCSCEAGSVCHVQCKFEVSILFSLCPSAAWPLFGGIVDGHWILESCDLDLQHFFFNMHGFVFGTRPMVSLRHLMPDWVSNSSLPWLVTIWQAIQSDHCGATRGVRECTKLREVRK